MRRRLRIVVLGFVVPLVGAGCASPPPEQPAVSASDVEEGRILYGTNGCAVCHGAEGGGDGPIASTLVPAPRDFRNSEAFKHARTVSSIAEVIATGLAWGPAPMPAYKHLDEASRRRLAGYVLSLGTGPRPAASMAIRVEDAWARQPPPTGDVTSAYALLINDGEAAVTVVAGQSTMARTLELHEMSMEGAMMRMRRVGQITIPAKSRVELKAGGLHIMLFGLQAALKAGDRLPLSLTLSDGRTVTFDATVRPPESEP